MGEEGFRPAVSVSAWACALLAAWLPLTSGSLLISQVMEGSSFNKAVVVSNRGAAPIATMGYSVRLAYNGGGWLEEGFPVNVDVLGPGDMYYICNTKIGKEGVGFCDDFQKQLLFNGNDAIGLFKGGVLVDKVGDETEGGQEEGSEGFTVNGVPQATRNHTIVRMNEVVEGTSDWEASSSSQWSIFPEDSLVVSPENVVVISKNAGGAPASGTTGSTSRVPAKPPVLMPTPKEPTVNRNGSLLVGTFNAEWLFDGIGDVARSPYANNPEAAEKHLQNIAKIIGNINPDIMNLCEVEDGVVLDKLVAAAGNGMERFFIQGTDTFLGQDVALISKARPTFMSRTNERVSFPVERSTCGYSREETTSVSKNYFAKFDDQKIFPFKFAMVGAHLKAIPLEPSSCAKREGQAVVLQKVIKDLIDQGYEVMVLGDLNDYSPVAPGPARYQPKSTVLKRLRDVDNDGVDELHNVLEKIPQPQRYTAHWDKNKNGKVDDVSELSAIDHILLTKKLWDRVTGSWVVNRIDSDSDHWPLMVQLQTGTVEADLL